MNPLSDWRFAMSISISCKELGMDCPFVQEGETGGVVIESLMLHVHTEHTDDWFEIEEIYQAACSVIREKAA
jgi:predicted small metal-binding protein